MTQNVFFSVLSTDLIVCYTLLEVLHDAVFGNVGVVRAGGLHLLDVGLDDGVVVADGLHEEELVALLHHDPLVQQPPSVSGGVGRVKHRDLSLQK